MSDRPEGFRPDACEACLDWMAEQKQKREAAARVRRAQYTPKPSVKEHTHEHGS